MIWDVSLVKQLTQRDSRFDLDVSFRSDSARLSLFGPSGAGKTQTLRMLAGIVKPDRGHASIGGTMLFDSGSRIDLSPQKRKLAFVFQDYALFPHLTLRQNIAFARRSGWFNPSRRVVDDAVDRWTEAFHLQAVSGHYPHQLSGGQRQRAALARALVNDPTALLLDEPFAALDQTLRSRLREEMRDLQSQLRIPMVVITHDEDDVRMLADDVIRLEAGRVVAATSPAA